MTKYSLIFSCYFQYKYAYDLEKKQVVSWWFPDWLQIVYQLSNQEVLILKGCWHAILPSLENMIDNVNVTLWSKPEHMILTLRPVFTYIIDLSTTTRSQLFVYDIDISDTMWYHWHRSDTMWYHWQIWHVISLTQIWHHMISLTQIWQHVISLTQFWHQQYYWYINYMESTIYFSTEHRYNVIDTDTF